MNYNKDNGLLNMIRSRVMNKQTNKIEYYNSKGVYRYENWK